jgi:threonyl-tRNA synthetase
VANKELSELEIMRHSTAHVMAAAVLQVFPEAKLGIGPAIENGFYYDFDLPRALVPEDLPVIESKMREIVAKNLNFERSEQPSQQVVDELKKGSQLYKAQMAENLQKAGATTLSSYKLGDFIDPLCAGPHVGSTKDVGAFKLVSIAGAYWLGDEKNKMLQRIYGVAFKTKQELVDYLNNLEEAKKRDHRKLGQELELFYFHETAPGMPYWLPKGVVIYNELVKFWRDEHYKRGYQEISSPLLNKKELYITSGHYEHYWEEMFTSETPEGESYALKAMNCPNAMLVFKMKSRSYRDLPLRLSDTDTLHRNEMSGVLNGLLRVREFRQDDAHIYVSADQIKEEYQRILEITELFYSIFGMSYSFRLGTRPEKFMGAKNLWDSAESTLKEILETSGKQYYIEEGDGAFYGPKVDILMTDVLGRPWQMGTIQLDFQQPLRFDLKYTDKDGSEKTPVAIHRVIYGSMERFIGILIEHTAGRFPVWLSPVQIRLVTVNQSDNIVDYARSVVDAAKDLGLRAEVDESNESVGKKIRLAEADKVPYTVVIGEKEVEQHSTVPRVRYDLEVQASAEPIKIDNFLRTVANEAKSRTTHTTM